jgi:spermidine synthase
LPDKLGYTRRPVGTPSPTPVRAASHAARLPLVAVAFFLSGAAALVYQVVWQRILELSSGIGIYSVAMIVGAFMAGLGLGSHAGSLWSTRLRPDRALWAFAAIELGVAVFGASSCALFYDLLYLRAGWLYSVPWRAGLLHFFSLLFPTLLMGMSLPFLARAMVHDAGRAARTIGILYGINVLGASFGAMATPWVLIRFAGMRGAVTAAAAANLLAGAAALLAAWRPGERARAEPQLPGRALEGSERPASRPLALWMGLYATSGFCALALEILWFRFLDVAVRSTAFTFGTLLSLYLLGCAVGSLAGSLLVARVKRPLWAFLVFQCLLLAWSAFAILLIARLPPDTPLLAYFDEAWRTTRFVRLGRDTDLGRLAATYLGLPALLFGVPTVLMGLSFPVLQRAVQDDVRTSGRKVGLLQAANIAGCIAGSLLVGLLLLDWIGTAGSFRLLAGVGVLFSALGIGFYGWRSIFAPLALGLTALVFFLPEGDQLWARLHGSTREAILVDEDATGVAALTPGGDAWEVWINGRSFSRLPFGGMHTVLGAIPAIVHPAPREVAIIGLGSGDTAWAVGCRGATTEWVTVFEISGPNLGLLERLRERGAAPPTLVGFLADPRVRHVVADGRNSLENARERYDVIEIDALWPSNAYSGNLYSVEFFELCARRLAPGGLMCSWCPTERVRHSFRRAFPHVIQTRGGQIMIGSNEPIRLDPLAWRRRATDAQVTAYLGLEQSQAALADLLTAEAAPSRRAGESLNRDLHPRDEFRAP